MKFRVDTINLTKLYGWTTNAGADVWIKVPIGVREGVMDQFSRLRGSNPDKVTHQPPCPAGQNDGLPCNCTPTITPGGPKDPGGKQNSILALSNVLEWNFDDEDGKLLPLMSTIKGDSEAANKKRLDLLAQLPLPLPGFVAGKIMDMKQITTEVEGNSKTSSASS